MKRILIFVLTCFFYLISQASVISGTCGENITWSLDRNYGSTLYISGTGPMDDYGRTYHDEIIPWNTFQKYISRVEISEGVTSIGNYAFYSCNQLTHITLPNTLVSIGKLSFSGCSLLTKIDLPNGLTHIGEYAFSGCTVLDSVIIPNSVDSIGESVFQYCESLSSFTLPNNITNIPEGTFRGCKSITSIYFPEAVTKIGTDAFQECSALDSVIIPDNIDSVFWGAFSGCTSLSYISIGKQIKHIKYTAFGGCTSLKKVVWNAINYPTSLGIIYTTDVYHDYYHIFIGCDSIETVEFGDEVEVIPENMCIGMKLKSVQIPNSVRKISNKAFRECDSLARITIGANVDTICPEAFYYCKALDSIAFPCGLRYIGRSAFEGCGISQIKFASGITNIRQQAFKYNSFKNLKLPNTIEVISTDAFRGNSKLRTVDIGNNLVSIGSGAFAACPLLNTITCRTSTPVTLPCTSYSLLNSDEMSSVVLKVPAESVNAYKNACGWGKHSSNNYYGIFLNIQPIKSELAKSLSATVEGENSATIEWNHINGAMWYQVVVLQDEDTVYKCIYDTTGQALPIISNEILCHPVIKNDTYSSRNYQCTIDNLLAHTQYSYVVTAINDIGDIFDDASGNFKTGILYYISFVNYDGIELQRSLLYKGELPIYSGETPYRQADAQYTYIFAGWSPEVVEVISDATYTATYNSVLNQYTITFMNDAEVLQSSDVEYGLIPIYSGATPTRANDDLYTYTFKGWYPEVVAVTGPATYMAKFEAAEIPGTTDLKDVGSKNVIVQKFTKDGQIFILRGDKTYTITGAEVK